MIDQKVKDLTLALAFLTGWEEDLRSNPDRKIFRCWKGFLYEILDALQKEKLVFQPLKAKSMILTDEGIEKAKKILERLGGVL